MVSGWRGGEKSHLEVTLPGSCSGQAAVLCNLRVTQLIGLSVFYSMLVACESGIPLHHNFFILPSVKMTK